MFNPLRNNRLITALVGLLLWTSFAAFGQNSIEEIKQEAKAAKLTPELLRIQQKEPSQTNKSLRQAASSEDEIKLTQDDQPQMRDDLIAIDAIANEADAKALLIDLQALGMTEGQYYKKIVSGYFPVSKLNLLRDVATLHLARQAVTPVINAGRTTSQGDKAMQADIARQIYNVTGAGSKIGILSDSYNALNGAAAGVASDDLPANVQVLKDFTPGTDEGRGMAEIVHDVAPGAAIAFHTAFVSYVDFAQGILRLAQAGCNIITDDIYYFAEPFFQDGIVSQALNEVRKTWNISYFKSAGNAARQSYSSGFRNSGRLPAGLVYPAGSAAHDFGNGRLTQRVLVPAGGSFNCVLQWSDPFYSESTQSGGPSGAKTDLDFIFYYNGVPLFRSINNNIGFDPYERISITNNGSTPVEIEIAIIKRAGPDPELIKWINFGSTATIEFDTRSSTVVGHANAQGAISVGAVRWSLTPVYTPVLTVPVIETFSSAGGTPILFTEYGQPIPATIRLKPDISAADGGNTTFFGQQFPGGDGDTFPNFFGTSAAAPHAAAVAALLQERAGNTMSPDDVLLRLRTTAIDMDDPLTPGFDTGFDFRTGFGFIQADKALMIDGQPLVLLPPLYDCLTGRITILTSGGNGSPITFTIPGVTRTSPTSTTGIVEAGLRNDPQNIIITAMQGSTKVVYDFNFDTYCKNQTRTRLAANELNTTLQIRVKGNPIATDRVDLEISGVEGKALKLQVSNSLGELTGSQLIESASAVENHTVSLGRSPGLYFLQVSTQTQSKTIKLIRHP